MAAMLQAKLQVLLLGGSDVLAATAELRDQLHGVAAHNKAQLAASLRGVELLQEPDGADPKLLAMSKLHIVGEVLGALFERLQKRDARQAEREESVWGALQHELLAHGQPPWAPSQLPLEPPTARAEALAAHSGVGRAYE